MRLFSALALATLPTVQAMPRPANGGVEIRDEVPLAALKAEHKHTLEVLRKGNTVTPAVRSDGDLDKRFGPIFGLAGFALIEATGTGVGISGGLANKLAGIFTDDNQDEIWHNHGHCRTYFQTQGGGNCETRTYNRDSGDATATHTDGG